MILKIKSKGKYYDVLIDDEDFDKIKNYKWNISYDKKRNRYDVRATIPKSNKKKILLHRLIMNAQKGKQVDHQYHKTLDNRKQNLRICTNQQNSFNRKKHKDSKSKYKGVTWHKKAKKWQASIAFNYKRIHLGLFENIEDAKKIYNKKAKELFGEFACLNK